MSKYLLLVLVNAPIVLIGIVRAITRYKTKPARISKSKCVIEVIFWLSIWVALSLIEPLYNTLIRHNLTDSPPMSIFDVVLLTLLIFCLLLIVETNEELTALKKMTSRMHEQMAITEAGKKKRSS